MDTKNLNAVLAYFTDDNNWYFQLVLIFVVAMVLTYISTKLLRNAVNQLKKTKTPWDELVIDTAIRPTRWLIWLLALTYAIDIIQIRFELSVLDVVSSVRKVGVIIILTFYLLNLKDHFQKTYLGIQKDNLDFDRHTLDVISKLIRIVIIVISGLVILQTLGYSVSGVLAFGGIGGIAIGFAAKDLLANFFGGLMIYLDKPFKAGDWIRSNDRNIEGTVEHIGWRLTQIKTFDHRPLYVPNSIFTTITVENPSRMHNRRIYETFGIRYIDSTKMEAIVKEVKSYLTLHPDIDTTATLIVSFTTLSPSSLDFYIYAYTKTTSGDLYREIKQSILLEIMQIVENNGAEFAFPTSTLHIETMAAN